MNGIHDVGGMDGLGPVEWEENEPVFHRPWEGRLRAIHMLASKKHKFYHLDESRSTLERIHPVYYMGSSYYQLWLLRTESLLIQKGVLAEEELNERMAQLSPDYTPQSHLQPYRTIRPMISPSDRKVVIDTTSGSKQPNESIQPKFSPGTVVTAKMISPLGHTRIPRYVRGKQGVIDSIHGIFTLPDAKVHAGIDLYQTVYRVRFEAQHLWGKDASPKDKLYIELWEDYLEPGGAENEKH
ncbi:MULTISPECIES: nitrile hydratase subunit beta [unclassified Paenibacillus]|uniref:nitrile hydratase subunit beta n=1 Tax=unclassified Paenibacillus TaxID=185978 RepID=UPI001AE9BC39|nr:MULTISPECIES: nitrile hydratase subunit beta [unclassified Paenibacillus]MBP1154148.1 nitrile hydratase [Paenibacillus sp. PvP091]MBP1170467.1 nitrile hydratase [Paenibacillus sp. PvR098]MBP2441495.1 nitrile hydratase [Paenibacillus sp. PvP052]